MLCAEMAQAEPLPGSLGLEAVNNFSENDSYNSPGCSGVLGNVKSGVALAGASSFIDSLGSAKPVLL